MAGARALLARHRDDRRGLRQADHRDRQQLHPVRPGHVHLKTWARWSPRRSPRPAASAGSSTRSRSTTASPWATAACSTRCPRRDLIADSVEYMVKAHCADALVCISNCDKITPGMLLAALRLNIPTVFVSGGPMEAGKAVADRRHVPQARPDRRDDRRRRTTRSPTRTLARIEESACPTCGSCSGMFTANSMNCLTEAIGLALPGNGSTLATHAARKALYQDAGRRRGRPRPALLRPGRRDGAAARDRHPGRVRERDGPRHRDGRLDQHRAAPARRRPGGRARLHPAPTSTRSPAGCPACAKVAPERAEVPHGGRAPRGRHPGHPRRAGPRRAAATGTCTPCTRRLAGRVARRWDIRGGTASPEAVELFHAAPGCVRTTGRSPSERWDDAGHRRRGRLHPRRRARLLRRGRPGRPARQPGADGCVVKTAGVPTSRSARSAARRWSSSRRRTRSRRSCAARSRPATSSWSATRAPRAGRACRRCSTRPRSSRAAGSARPAR